MKSIKIESNYVCRGYFLGILTLSLLVSNAGATVLFEDNFDSGVWKPEWQSKMCCQWIEDGWLHAKDTDGWPRDSMAVVHDGDMNWKDYKISLKAQFVPSEEWDYFNILTRTNNFLRSSEVSTGSAYQLEFRGERGWQSDMQNTITLNRWDIPAMTHLYTVSYELPADPMNLYVEVEGAGIRLWINGQPVFDFIDPSPLPYGGVGVHTTFESEARFDDIIVTDIGIPASIDINPDTLSLMSKGKWITAYIGLPEGYDVKDINVSTIKLKPGNVSLDPTAPATIGDDGISDMMVKFDRANVSAHLSEGNEVKLTVTGKLMDGTAFEGNDTIRVIK